MADMNLVDRQTLARTFESDLDRDPETLIETFERYEILARRHGTESSMLLASSLDVTRPRVHRWLRGEVPDPVRVVRVTTERGWLPLTTDSAAAMPLNRLVAALMAGGHFAADGTPAFVVETAAAETAIRSTLDGLHLGATVTHVDGPNTAKRLQPATDGDVLGRMLLAVGLPRTLTSQTPLTLPGYLLSVSSEFRFVWLGMYTLCSADSRTAPHLREGGPIQLSVRSDEDFREALVSLFRLELPDRECVTVEDGNIRLSARAVKRILDQPGDPELLAADPERRRSLGTQLG